MLQDNIFQRTKWCNGIQLQAGCYVGLVVALTLAYQGGAMLPILPQQVLLLSEKSGKFVSVGSGGVVTAQALRSGKVL